MCVGKVHRLKEQQNKFNDRCGLWFRNTLAGVDNTSEDGEFNVV